MANIPRSFTSISAFLLISVGILFRPYSGHSADSRPEKDASDQKPCTQDISKQMTLGIYKGSNYFCRGGLVKALEELGANGAISLSETKLIDELSPESLVGCEVLILAGTRRYDPELVLGFVSTGHGALFIHNACRTGIQPVFSNLWSFAGIGECGLRTTDVSHPITSGLPQTFSHAYTEHARLHAGVLAKAVMKDEEGFDVVIAAEVGAGRVVAMGTFPGWGRPPGKHDYAPPQIADAEKTMLANAVNWLAATDHVEASSQKQIATTASHKKNDDRHLLFADITASSGTAYRWYSKATAMVDVDNDGDLDIYCTLDDQRDSPHHANKLFRNDGDMRFTDIAAQSGLAERPKDGIGCVFGDVNDDGNLDLFVSRIPEMGADEGDRNFLFLGNGKGQFVDATEESGLAESPDSMNCVLTDIENDGDLDLYIVCLGADNRLYRNNGKGVYTDITGSAGLTGVGNTGHKSYGSSACSFADLDNDGFQDMVCFKDGQLTLYRNKKDSTFEQVADTGTGHIQSDSVLGLALGDIDNDGDLDLYCSTENLLRNDGAFHLTDITDRCGFVKEHHVHPYGPIFADIDNDGFLDLFQAIPVLDDMLYHNNGNMTFSEIPQPTGFNIYSTHGCCFGDLDNDGDLDFYGTTWGRDPFKVLRNNTDDNNYLKVRVRGTKSNTSGIGAQIWVHEQGTDKTCGKLRGYREILGGGGCMYHCPPLEQHFGLTGDGPFIVKVSFPVSGKTITRTDILPGNTVDIVEPE